MRTYGVDFWGKNFVLVENAVDADVSRGWERIFPDHFS